MGGCGLRVSGLVLGSRVSGLRFQVSGLLRVSGFGFRVSGFELRISGLEFRVSGFGVQVSGLLRVSGFGFRVSGPEAWQGSQLGWRLTDASVDTRSCSPPAPEQSIR